MCSSSRPKLPASKRPSRNGGGITGRTPLMDMGLLGRTRGTDGLDGVADAGDEVVAVGAGLLGQHLAAVADGERPGLEEVGGVAGGDAADCGQVQAGEGAEQIADVPRSEAAGREELDGVGA